MTCRTSTLLGVVLQIGGPHPFVYPDFTQELVRGPGSSRGAAGYSITLIRPLQERRRDRQAKSLGRLEVNDQLELRRLLDGEVDRLGALQLVNRALAYHDALSMLFRTNIQTYTESRVIPIHPDFSPDPEERAVVIVRDGYGAVGLKDNWTASQILAGKIPSLMGRFTAQEVGLLHADPARSTLPAR